MTTAGWQEGHDVRPPVFSGPRSRGGRGGAFDMTAFVNRVVDEWEEETGARVERSGRDALIGPALPHAEDVQSALESGGVSMDFLENCVREVLRNAHEITGDRMVGGLGAADIQLSMRRYCPYVFWC